MTANEAAIRNAYQVAEDKDIVGFVNSFTEDGTFTDESIGVTYRGPKELGRTVEVYAMAFPDIIGSCTPSTSLATPSSSSSRCRHAQGTADVAHRHHSADGEEDEPPCCDVFQLINGKIKSFNCYPSGTVVLTQLGILEKLKTVL